MTTENTPAERILLVDDNMNNLQVLISTLKDLGYALSVANSGERALAIASKTRPDLVLLDIMMPGIDGYDVCRQLKADPDTEQAVVIFLTALDDVHSKVKGFEVGGADFITKPFQTEEVRVRVCTQMTMLRLRRELLTANQELRQKLVVAAELLKHAHSGVAGPLQGTSPAIRRLNDGIVKIARKSSHVRLTGSPASIHECVARAIHLSSDRRDRPFIYVDCTALAGVGTSAVFPTLHPTPLRSSCWGGGSKSADREYEDKLTAAEGGTLYLDRVESLPLEMQTRLHGFLEQAECSEQPPNVRIISFASGQVDELVAKGDLSESLVGLLSQTVLPVPPLNERREDIPVLAQFFMEQHARRLGRMVARIEPDTMERLSRYDWPGGVQELQNLIERQVLLTHSSELRVEPHAFEGVSLGGYQLLCKLGEGGMGEVWLAKHRLLARPAAVKLIRASSFREANQTDIRGLFYKEAQATAKLRSVNTVQLYDFGVDTQDGTYYYVMELLFGLSLDEMVKRFKALEPERVVYFLCQACRSLVEAHEFDLVHRDIKPANLFACKLGTATDVLKVLDFGVVRSRGDDETHDVLAGSPGYIAPEIIRRMDEVDGRADIYSLGCVAFFLLTGQTVFTADSWVRLCQKHLESPPPEPSQLTKQRIPLALEELVMLCLRKDPAQRPTATSLLERLLALEFEHPWTEERAAAWWRSCLGGVVSDPLHVAAGETTVPARRPDGAER